MSIQGNRAAIAAALNGVPGVQGHEYKPTVKVPGDAWPLLSSLEAPIGLTYVVVWRVLVFLPQNEQAASDWIDEHHESLVDALLPVGFVERIEPVNVQADSAPDQFHLQLTMRSE